jgi:hypothetical protein
MRWPVCGGDDGGMVSTWVAKKVLYVLKFVNCLRPKSSSTMGVERRT